VIITREVRCAKRLSASLRMPGWRLPQSLLDAMNVVQDLCKADRAVVFTSRNQWRHGFGEKERVDFVERQYALLQGVEKVRVRATARAEGFQGQRVASTLAQVGQEQCGKHGLADAGVGARYEEDTRRQGQCYGLNQCVSQCQWRQSPILRPDPGPIPATVAATVATPSQCARDYCNLQISEAGSAASCNSRRRLGGLKDECIEFTSN
jgi:hypothetical protein